MKVIGVDPGAGGGIAVLQTTEGSQWEAVEILPTPETIVDISEVFERHKDANIAYIESVHSMPKQGVASMFKFGMFYGYVKMAVAAHHIRCEDVTPGAWQKKFGLTSLKGESKTAHKNRLKQKAQNYCTKQKVTLKTADAILIAIYGLKKELGL